LGSFNTYIGIEIERKGATPLAIILCPTRELAEQVEWNIYQYGKYIPNLRIVGVQGAFKDVNAQVRLKKKEGGQPRMSEG